jgi:ferredoxin-nitrite reductase
MFNTFYREDIASDDIDVRVKYAGMFHRKKATPGKFMMRLRIPNGIVTAKQMRYFAEAVRPYGPDNGVVDITTRANIQLRSPPLEDAVDILENLKKLGLSSLMSGLDNLRNMVGSPIAGIDPHETYDTRALTRKIDQWYTNEGQGNPEWYVAIRVIECLCYVWSALNVLTYRRVLVYKLPILAS